MNRIPKAYQARFRAVLQRAGARRLEQGVQSLVIKARRLSARRAIPFSQALTQVYGHLVQQPWYRARPARPAPTRFFCDAGLGGLARWLRAAGYEAFWEAGIDDDQLLRDAERLSATLLTTDSMLTERRLLRDEVLPSFWLPPTLPISEQLTLVFQEFGLPLLAPRCMVCGGELRREDKEALRARIPPRTYRWLDEFFICRRCGRLFWHGTHWKKIRAQLTAITQSA